MTRAEKFMVIGMYIAATADVWNMGFNILGVR